VGIAYQYDRFRVSVLKLAPFILFWMFGTSIAVLATACGRVLHGRPRGLILSLLIYVAAGLLLHAALGYFLPNYSITEANIQT
jgi:hypothetical protein